MKIETLAVHASNEPDPATGALAAPIHLSTTFLRAEDGSYPGGYVYGRADNPNRERLEAAVSALEGGADAAAFASGLAAIHSIFQSLRPGDHAVVSADIYHGTRALLQQIIERWGLQVTFVPFDDLAVVEKALKKNTRLVYLETPSNPLLKIIDIASAAEMAHGARALLVADNTLATPVLQRPLELGADIVVHSSTKYFGGHSDVTSGAVIVKEENEFFERIRQVQTLGGGVSSPFDCWLVRRGLATLPLRVRAQAANAQAIAEFLASHPAVNRVYYPGLPTHPGHEVARKQMSAAPPIARDTERSEGGAWQSPSSLPLGAMLSFQVAAGEAAARKLAASTKLFKQATSLGGIESMIEHRASIVGEDPTTPRDLLRLSVGIEAAEDLVEDLDRALSLPQ